MKALLTYILVFSSYTAAQANDMYIVDVRRNITLAEDEPVYKDFYINTHGQDLKKNLVITAVRKINIRDASGANAIGEITVPVGQLKVIATYDRVAVAREYKLLSREDLPMLEQIGIMTGDQIDLAGSFVDNKKRKPASTAPVTNPVAAPQPASPPVDSAKIEVPAPLSPLITPKPLEVLEKTADSGTHLTP